MKSNLKKFYCNVIAVIVMSVCFIGKACAICPICAIAVGAGIGLAQWLGTDDSVTGLWVGGLVVSLIMWTIYWLDKKNIRFKGRIILTTVLYYLLIVFPLYPIGIIGHPLNKLWGMDKLVLGVIIGSVFFFVGGMLHFALKKAHNNRVYFPFQKVVFPIVPLIILSFVFYFITR